MAIVVVFKSLLMNQCLLMLNVETRLEKRVAVVLCWT